MNIIKSISEKKNAFQEDQGRYSKFVKDMVAENQKRLVVNINDLRRKNPTRAAR